MSDPEQASKLPVSSGQIDRSLKSTVSKVGFYKTLFFIVQNTNILTSHTMWIFSLFLPPLWAQKHLYVLWVIPIFKGISKADNWNP